MICCCCCYCDFRDWSKSCSLFNYSNTISLFSSRLYLTRIGRSNKKIYLPVTLTLNKEGGCLSGPNLKLKSQLAFSFMSHLTVRLDSFLKTKPHSIVLQGTQLPSGLSLSPERLGVWGKGSSINFCLYIKKHFFCQRRKNIFIKLRLWM